MRQTRPRTVAEALDAARASLGEGVRALNLGCGHDRREGFVNLDLATLPGLDVVGRFGAEELPFPDGCFDLILAVDVLEHVEFEGAFRELHRMLSPGGRVVISTVHFTSRNLYVDPTHRRGFSARTFDYVVQDGRTIDRGYYFDFAFAAVATRIQFSARFGMGRYLVWDHLLEPLVNRSRALQDLYEMTGASRMFPAANVLAVLTR